MRCAYALQYLIDSVCLRIRPREYNKTAHVVVYIFDSAVLSGHETAPN